MGPIEITFFVVLAIFALVGIVRGLARELGVTIMLLLGLLVLLLLDRYLADEITNLLAFLVGPDVALQKSIQALVYNSFMVLMAFISYEGRTLSFASIPLLSAEVSGTATRSGGSFVSMLAGLLNGYLLGGTIWYYGACANWPLLDVAPPYTNVYYAISAILPPVIFQWYYVVVLIVLLLIIRVWK